MSTAIADNQPRLFGHPTGLFTLFFAEMWERFSYYGMRALLVFYMIKGFLGYNDSEAYEVYGAYTALVYATPFIGGMLADRFMGARKAVIIGGALMAAGHLLMTLESEVPFFGALALLILGNGFFKPNISTIVGNLYPPGDERRDAGFTLFYMGINLGAAAAPLLCGYIGEMYGWPYGFGLATIGMLVGLAVFVAPAAIAMLLILVCSYLTAGAMIYLNMDNPITLAANSFVGICLMVAATVAAIAINKGGLPEDAGRHELDETNPGATTRYTLMALFASLALVPVVAFLVYQSAGAKFALGVVGLGALGYILFEMARGTRVERDRLIVVLVLMIFSMLFWAFFELAGSAIANFTDRNVDRVSDSLVITPEMVGEELTFEVSSAQLGYPMGEEVFTMTDYTELRESGELEVTWVITETHVGMAYEGSEVPATNFTSANPIFILLFGLAFSGLWGYLGARNIDPPAPYKFGLGLLQLGLGFLVLWYGAQNANEFGMVWAGWLLIAYLLHTTGELCLSPVGLSMVTKLSPARLVSTVMGAWFLATAFSNLISAMIAGLTGVESHGGEEGAIPPPIDTLHTYGDVFLQIGGFTVIASLVLFVASPFLTKMMHLDEPMGEGAGH